MNAAEAKVRQVRRQRYQQQAAREKARAARWDPSRPLEENIRMAAPPPPDRDPARTVQVASRSRPGYYYDVRIALDGQAICECPAAMNNLHCWHQEEAREKYMATQQAVAIRPIELDRMALVPTTEMIEGVRAAAKLALGGRMTLPAELDSETKVVAVMMYGLELGLRPMTALKHLYIVKGKVALSSEVMAGMLMRADPKAKLIVERCEVEAGPDGKGIKSGICTMRIVRPSRDIDQRWTVTWDQIVRAGLARDNNLQYPEDRLRYHCTKRLLRTYAPDLINAFDEEPSVDGLQAHYRIEGAPEPPTDDEDSLYNPGDEPQDGDFHEVDNETGEIFAAPMATDDQVKEIKRLWDSKHFNIATIRERYPEAFPAPSSRSVNSPAKLTAAEADDVIALLGETPKAPAAEPCEHEARMDEERAILICAKCGVALEGPESAQQPSMLQ